MIKVAENSPNFLHIQKYLTRLIIGVFLTGVMPTITTSIFAQVCDCNEFLYLNDTESGEVHKFLVNAIDGTISEIGDPWMSGFDDPHGLGVDLNGNFYIGDRSQGPIYQVNCDGGTVATDAALWTSLIQWDLYNIGSYDGYIITNGGGPGLGNRINVFDPCTGTLVGSFCLEGLTNDWGLQVLPNGTILVTDGGFSSTTKSVYQFQFDYALLNAPGASPLICIDPFVESTDVLNLPGPLTINGTTYNSTIMLSDFGSLYGITSDGTYLYVLANAASFGISYLLKIDAITGTLVAVVDETQSTNSTVGWAGALGLVYAPSSGLLYVSGYEDCISILDPADLSYIAAGAGPVGPNSNPKAVALVKECCPMNDNQTIDLVECVTPSSAPVFLNDIFPCDGTICEGQWTPVDAASAAVYESCDQSINSGIGAGCYSFERSSDGTASNAQCGAFYQRLNLEIVEVEEITVATPMDTVCQGGSLTLTATTTATNLRWQSSTTSCLTGFTDISGATSNTLNTGSVTTTTYYRAVVSGSNTGNGDCEGGDCDFESNCVTVIVDPGCVPPCINPTATATATDPTCTGSTANSDGTIILSGFTTEKYDMVMGSSYTGTATYATATAIPAGGMINNTLTNPSGSEDYTIRIFNGDDCFVDRVVTINFVDCCEPTKCLEITVEK